MIVLSHVSAITLRESGMSQFLPWVDRDRQPMIPLIKKRALVPWPALNEEATQGRTYAVTRKSSLLSAEIPETTTQNEWSKYKP